MRALALAGLLLLAACSSGSDAAPAGSPSPVAGVEVPADFATWELGPVSFATPPELEVVELPPPAEGVEELALRAPSDEGEPAAATLAVLTAEPERTAAEEADSLVEIKRDVQRARDVRREEAALPGFASAFVVTYEQEEVDGSVRRTSMLVAEIADGPLFTLTVIGPAEAFADGALETVVRTASAG